MDAPSSPLNRIRRSFAASYAPPAEYRAAGGAPDGHSLDHIGVGVPPGDVGTQVPDVAVGDGVLVVVQVAVAVAVGVADGVGVSVGVTLATDGVAVGVGVSVPDRVGDWVGVGVRVSVTVAVGPGVGVFVGGTTPDGSKMANGEREETLAQIT
jgi:hypothetical protein